MSRRPLRVVHVIGGLELGGAETLLYRLAIHPIPGIEQQVICLGEPDWYSSRLQKRGIEVHHLGMRSPLTGLTRVGDLRTLLAKIDPDVIQSWMYLANMLSSAVARRRGTPVVWGIHNSSFERVGLASRLSAYAAGAAARQLATFVVNCSRHSSDLHAKLGYSAVSNRVIANGYDVLELRPDADARDSMRRALGLNDPTFVVGSISRWHPHKDIPNLLDSVRIAADADVPLRCLLIGRGLGPDNHQLAAAIKKAGCQDLVVPLGTRSDVANLARAIDLHVLSSRSEAFPNVVAETMLSGTPNVVTDAGDSGAIVADQGWVVPPSDPQGLAAGILKAWSEWSSEPSRWRRRQEGSRRRIAENFTFEKMAQAYADVWRQVAAAPTAD